MLRKSFCEAEVLGFVKGLAVALGGWETEVLKNIKLSAPVCRAYVIVRLVAYLFMFITS